MMGPLGGKVARSAVAAIAASILLAVQSTVPSHSQTGDLRKWLQVFPRLTIDRVRPDMDQPSTLHISANQVHFVSNDAGANWQLSKDHRGLYVRDPNDGRTYFWAGTDFSPKTQQFAVGIFYRSRDDATTWQRAWPGPFDPFGEIRALWAPLPGPGVPSAVFASTSVGVTRGITNFYVWRTLNGGDSWQQVSLLSGSGESVTKKFITAFAFDSQRGISYAASSKRTLLSDPGLWKSADYFQSERTELPLPAGVEEIRDMFFSQGVLLLVGAGPPLFAGGVWVTDNEGASWFPLTENLDSYAVIQAIAVMATTPPKLVAGTDSGLYIRDLPAIQHTYLPLVNNRVVTGW